MMGYNAEYVTISIVVWILVSPAPATEPWFITYTTIKWPAVRLAYKALRLAYKALQLAYKALRLAYEALRLAYMYKALSLPVCS